MGKECIQGFLVEKCKGKKPTGKPRHRWEDTVTTNFKEMGWGCGLGSSDSGLGPVVGIP
jgi:hypothetical protein